MIIHLTVVYKLNMHITWYTSFNRNYIKAYLVLVYHKCLSVTSAIYLNNISETIEVNMKLQIKMYQRLTEVGQIKRSVIQLIEFKYINLKCNMLSCD